MTKQFILITLLLAQFFSFGQAKDCVCCTSNHEAFDFWLGQWEVTNPDGSLAGNNSITKIQDNCVLVENWVSATQGFTGTSTNFYNSKTQLWEQIWVDNKGTSLHLKGKRIGNQMILESDELKDEEGRVAVQRITWTVNDDGTVRQLWETLLKNGKSVIAFDGLYKKR